MPLLMLLLGVPVLEQLFAFPIPGPGLLLICCMIATLTLGRCERLKRCQHPPQGLDPAPTACSPAYVVMVEGTLAPSP